MCVRIACKLPKSVEFKFCVRLLHLLGVQEDSGHVGATDNEPDSGNVGGATDNEPDLKHVLTCYLKKRKRRNVVSSFQSKLQTWQCCLELVLDYQVYQVSIAACDMHAH